MLSTDTTNLAGNIGVITHVAPYQDTLRALAKAGAVAAIAVGNRSPTLIPGQAMYYIISGDEAEITIPVVTIFQYDSDPKSLHAALREFGQVNVNIWAQENLWKTANDVYGFQVTFNIILSGMQVTIILIALVRLYDWSQTRTGLLSIAPVCILLQTISAILRLVLTLVDPFYSFRTMSFLTSNILTTLWAPFFLTSGILLTMYWAETIRRAKVEASPFISEYRNAAFVVVALLFIGEITCTTLRCTVLAAASFNPAYIAEAFYALVALVLTIAYIYCAATIISKLKEASTKRQQHLRSVTLRFAISTSGYLLFVLTLVLSLVFSRTPWGWKCLMNILVLAINISSIIQIGSFAPPPSQMTGSTKSWSAHSLESMENVP